MKYFENRSREAPADPYFMSVTQSCRSVWTGDNKVSVMVSHKKTGINRHSGKRWYRWSNEAVYGLRRNHLGTITGYHLIGGRHAIPDSAFILNMNELFLVGDRPTQSAYIEAVEKVLGVRKFSDIFPIAEHYNIHRYNGLPAGTVHAYRNTDLGDFCREVYGKSLYRKDLVKATGQATPYGVSLARQFRGLVPVDWIVDFLRTEDGFAQNTNVIGVRPLLKKVSENTRRNLLRNYDNEMVQVGNLANRLRGRFGVGYLENDELDTRRFRNWTELHDYLIGPNVMPRYKRPEPVASKIPQKGHTETLDGQKMGEFTVVMAKHTNDLYEWGEYMHNCINSYADSAARGGYCYGALTKDDKVFANFEVTPNGKVKQLLGRYNQTLPVDVIDILEPEFNRLGFDTYDYWGKPVRGIDYGFQVV